jgi:excisionase family DNA binding protein
MLTVKESSQRLQVSESLVYALCATGRIDHHRCGLGRGTIRIEEKALEDYLNRSRVIGRSFPQGGDAKFKQLDSSRLISAWKQQGVL